MTAYIYEKLRKTTPLSAATEILKIVKDIGGHEIACDLFLITKETAIDEQRNMVEKIEQIRGIPDEYAREPSVNKYLSCNFSASPFWIKTISYETYYKPIQTEQDLVDFMEDPDRFNY